MNSDDDNAPVNLTEPFIDLEKGSGVTRDLRAKFGFRQGMDTLNTAFRASSKAVSSLEIRFKEKRGFGIPYSYVRGVEYDFTKDKQVITLHTAVGAFKFLGFHLSGLKDDLLSHTVQWVQEQPSDEKPTNETPVIVKIEYLDAYKE